MSHFTVMVITDNKPTASDLHAIMQPFHEFECTGVDDEYVQNIDVTEERKEEYLEEKTQRYVSPDGEMYSPYKDRFYRDPTEAEAQKIGIGGTGITGGILYESRDWNDGRGYRTKVHFLPEGWTEVEMNTRDVMSFAEWLRYDGMKTVTEGESHDNEDLKYSFAVVDEKDEVLHVYRRTNPNKQWDWWEVGGRWSGFLKPKFGASFEKGAPGLQGSQVDARGADIIRKGDVDFEGMRTAARVKAEALWHRVRDIVGEHINTLVSWEDVLKEHQGNVEIARDAYRKQSAVAAFDRASGKDLFWLRLDDFRVSLKEYSDAASANAVSTFAVLKDGQWVERGKMGWWGVVRNEQDSSAWAKSFNEMLDALPDDTWLTIIDCHI